MSLHIVLTAKNVDAVRAAIAAGADVNELRSFSVLEKAIMAGQLDVVRVLLEAGADPVLGVDGALVTALKSHQPAVVELLLAKGVDPTRRPGALDAALRWRAEAALDLLGRGVPFTPDTVLRAASARGALEARGRVVELAIAASTAPQALLSALIASRQDLERVWVERLLAKGASLTPGDQPSPLHEAALQAQVQAVEVLLALGASAETPLAVDWAWAGKTWKRGLSVGEAFVEFKRYDLRGRDPGTITRARTKLLERVAQTLGLTLKEKKKAAPSRDPAAPVKVRAGWRRFHHANGRFWEVRAEGEHLRTRFGRVGLDGRNVSKLMKSAAEAKRALVEACAEKVKEGYVEVGAKPAR